MLSKVDEFEVQGRRFTLYEGGSFILFEEDADGAEGLGAIVRAEPGYVVTAWWKPELTITASTLPEAVNRLIEITTNVR